MSQKGRGFVSLCAQ